MSTSSGIMVVGTDSVLLDEVRDSSRGQKVTAVANAEEALLQIGFDKRPALVVLDLAAPAWNGHGLNILQQLKTQCPEARFVVICASGDVRKGLLAMRMGAEDCLVRPFTKDDLLSATRCLATIETNSKNSPDVEEVGEGWFMVAASPAMRKIRAYCDSVAKVDLPVLILGESGTGKEVVARLIHKISSRANRPFLKVNCAAMPAELLESELFGYEQGAFTGATHAKPGKFEQCNKGTIFLDEIGEMHPDLQAKLLHVLQDREFSRLGGRNVIKVDVRVLAATNIDIREALATRKLRDDLFFRLNTFAVRMPPLRERKEEISILLEHFAKQFTKQWGTEPAPLSPTLMNSCYQYPWPGNVRELENFANRWQLLKDEESAIAELALSAHEFMSPARTRTSAAPESTVAPEKSDQSIRKLKAVTHSAIGEAESAAISQALARTRWNRKRAAELLDISYKALLYKIKQYDLEGTLTSTAAAD